MPTWLDITIKIITLVIGILGLLGLGAYFSEKFKHRANNEINEAERHAAEKEKQFENNIRKIVREETQVIKDDVESIKKTNEKQIKADILNERCNMWQIHNRCKAQGFSDVGDKVTMKELYNNYKENGGNEFRAFVDRWFNDVENLPDELPEENN